MRYDDTSGSFNSAAAGTPDARDDTDNMAAGSRAPVTGNAISGEGTVTGAAGADIIGNAPGQIVALQGANGSDTADSGGSLQAAGRYGTLTMNEDGAYSYRTTGAAPENARDVFSYTLADQSGGRDTALLAIDIGHTPSVAANAQQLVPGPDGVVTLPPGVELSDVHVVGRNLVIDMPDGSQMVIIDGAVFVPQLVLGGVEVPASNLAALLIDSEPKPGAGTPQSGGGNFAVDVGPLDPGVPLGDLIPPTELDYTPPEPEEVNQFEDDEPEIIIIPDGQPGAVNAVDSVDESGLPERPGEPEGTLEPQNIETTTGVISISADDGIDSVTINGVDIDSVGDTVETARGILTITSIDLDSGEIGYSYTATDNTTDGVDDFDDFTVVVTDDDGDTATGTLHIDILDDEPIARNDTDSVTLENPTAVGNVMTAVGTTNSPAGVDTVGADDASLTAVQGVGPVDTTFDINGNLVVEGLFGTLTIDADGEYTYVRDEGTLAGGNDVFTYTLTDGDGDTVTATLTITVPTIPDPNEPPIVADAIVVVSEEALDGGLDDNEGEFEPSDSATATGDVIVNDPDGDPTTATLGIPSVTLFSNDVEVEWELSADGHTLTGTAGGTPIITVTITDSGVFEVELQGPIDHDDPNTEDGLEFDIPVSVSDGTDTVPATITVRVADDSPVVTPPQAREILTFVVDESPVGEDEGPGEGLPVGVRSDTHNLAGAFNPPEFGGDGEGSVSYGLELSVEGAGSGLFALDPNAPDGKGGELLLFSENGSIVGRLTADGEDYFTISVVPTGLDAGDVTFEQSLNVWHSDTDSDDDTSTLIADAGVLELVQTVTDADGDSDTGSIDLGAGGYFNIEDDGPSIGEVDINDSIVIDETDAGEGTSGFPLTDTTTNPVITGTSISTGTDGGTTSYGLILAGGVETLASGLQTAQGDYAITLVQTDADTITGVYTDGDDNEQTAFTIEIDGDGRLTYTQEVPLEHSDDGPTATDHNDTNTPLTFEGLISATITVTDTDGDSETASADLGDAITIFDDGPDADVDEEFEVPTIVLDESPEEEPEVDEEGDFDPAGLGSTTVNLSGAFVTPPQYGADGAGSVNDGISYALVLTGEDVPSGMFGLEVGDTDDVGDDGDGIGQGEAIVLNQDPITGLITGSGADSGDPYFTISVDAETGEVTFTQVANVWHSDTGSDDDTSFLNIDAEDGSLELVQTVTDSDGDFDTASIDLGDDIFQIEDDGPSIGEVDINDSIVIDETDAGEGTSGFPLTDTTTNPVITGTGISTGTDGGTTSYGLILAGGVETLASGLQTAQGDYAITLVQTDADTITGVYTDGDDNEQTAFTIEIDGDGRLTYTQEVPLEHSDDGPTATDHNDTNTPLTFEGLISATITVTDTDGDSETASADLGDAITIFDDGPDAGTPTGTPPTLTLDESPVPSGGDGVTSISSTTIVNLFGTAAYGADGADGDPAYTLLLTADAEGGDIGSGLFALDNTDTDPGTELGSDGDGYGQGEEILLVQIDDQTIEGQLNGTTYFTITVDPSSGEVTFSQQENVWHDDASDPDDAETLTANGGTLEIVRSITDGDGDTDTATVDLGSGVFIIEDDGPSEIEPEATNVEQGGSATSSLDLVGPDDDAAGVDDNYGTDGPGTVRFPASLEGTAAENASGSPLTSGGAAILYHVSADGLTLYGYVEDETTEGFQGDEDTTVFTIVLDPGSSEYTVTLNEQIDSRTTIDFNDGSYDFVGGNDPWAGFVPLDEIDGKQNDTPLDNDSEDLLLTPFSATGEGNAINGTANSAGVTGGGAGQNISTGEGIRLDFVNDLLGNPAGTPANYDENQAQQDHEFDDHYLVNDVSVKFGEGDTNTTIKIEIFDNVDNPDNYVLGEGELVNITQVVISFDGENQVFEFDADELSQTESVGLANATPNRDYTVTWVLDSEGVYHVEVTGILDDDVRIATRGETDYEALEIEYVSGDDFEITGFGAVTQSTDPVPFSVPVEIVDADGDTAAGEIDITVYPVGDLPEADAFASLSMAKFSELDSQSLLTEDSGKHHSRSFDAANNNSVLLGAIAAAGLASSSAAANHRGADRGEADSQLTSLTVENGSKQASSEESQANHALTGETRESVDARFHDGHVSRKESFDDSDHSLTKGESHQAPASSELLAGTDAPQQDAPAASSLTSGAVAMPSAEMLTAAKADGSSEGEAKGNAVVEQVIADALAGGNGGPSIEAVIDAHANRGHGGDKGSNDGLASLGQDGGSHWDTAGLAHFPGGQAQFTMETIQLHHDAVQPAA